MPTSALGVACLYCSANIPSALFAPWTGRHRLVSTFCPHCGRAVTMSSLTLDRRQTRQSGPAS